MPATDVELQLTDTFGTWKDKFNQAIGDINTAIDNLPEFNTLAPTNHASTAMTYGVGNANSYGHLKLSDATNSTAGVSSGVAATPAAVKTAYDKASTLATSSAAGIVKPGTGMTVDAAGALNVNSASTSQKGIVQLNSSVSSTSETTAATSKAVKTAYDKASTLATSSAAGIVKPGTGMTVDAAGALKVSLNNTVTSTSTTQAATANAVKTAYDKAVEASNKSGLPLGHIYLWPFSTPPDGSIQINGSTYSRELYSDLWSLIQEKGWYKSESEWQQIASANGGYCPWYSDGDGSTTFRTPKFAPYQKIALASGDAGKYYEAGLPDHDHTIITYGDMIDGGGQWAQRWTNTRASKTGMASASNGIYGRSTTVTPESHDWIVCVVAFGTATNVGSVDVANVMSAVSQVQAEVSTKLEDSTVHITETWKSSNGSSWYVKFSNGFIMQATTKYNDNEEWITLPTPFTTTVYTVEVSPTGSDSVSASDWGVLGAFPKKREINRVYIKTYANYNSTALVLCCGY